MVLHTKTNMALIKTPFLIYKQFVIWYNITNKLSKLGENKTMKNIIVTGANGGIGSEIVKRFASNDCNVIAIFHNHNAELTKLKNLFNNVFAYKCDLTDEDNIVDAIQQIVDEFKHIDCLINCAGISLTKQVQDISVYDVDNVLNSNLKSTILTTKCVVKNMISNKSGKIINISSIWGVVGGSVESVYSASKGGVNAFTLALAKELGPSGITVNAVCPGLINTKMNAHLSENEINDLVASTPISRMGNASDVANLVEFLASEKADFITGQIITVDGGLTL